MTERGQINPATQMGPLPLAFLMHVGMHWSNSCRHEPMRGAAAALLSNGRMLPCLLLHGRREPAGKVVCRLSRRVLLPAGHSGG